MILFTTSNERHANRTSATTRAYSIAQGGIDSAVSQLGALDDMSRHIEANYPCTAAGAAATPSTCRDSVDGGTVSWTGALSGSAPRFVWRFTSTATLSDPSNPGGTIRRTVTADVALRPMTQINNNSDSWRYVYSRANDNDPNTCDQTILNNPAVTSSFYVNGDLCLDNSSNVYGPVPGEPAVDVVVKGRAYLNHPATSLGTLTRPLTSIEVDLGCQYRTNPLHAPPTPCTAVDKVWPNSIFPGLAGTPCATSCPVVNAPITDFALWYAESSPGPTHPCEQTTGSGVPVFDTDTTMGNQGTRIVDLAPNTSYSCETPTGKLIWDEPTRTLTVEGTIYFDASADFSSDGVIQYDGMAAIYLSGSLRLRQTIICGLKNAAGDGCDPVNWDAGSYPSDVVVFVTNGTGTPATSGAGMTFEQSSGFQGALYANLGNMTFENNTWVQGPMIAQREVITNSMFFHYIPPLVNVPFGMPGTVITRYSLTAAKRYTG